MCQPTRRRGLDPWPTVVRIGLRPSRARGIAAMVVMMAALFAVPAAAITVTVPDDWPTIQQAIDSDADSILVRPGSYPETLVVARPVHLRGLVPEGASPDSLPTVAGLVFKDLPLLPYWQTSYIKISDLRFSGPVRNVSVIDTSPYRDLYTVAIEIARCALDAGLSDEGAPFGGPLEYYIRSCRIDGPTRLRFAYGVLIELSLVRQPISLDADPPLNHIEWLSLFGNHITGSGEVGVVATRTSELYVRENTFEGYERPLRGGSSIARITDNTFIGPGLVACEVDGSGNFTGNRISGFDVGIQSLGGEDHVLVQNELKDCRIAAVQARADYFECVDNDIRSCGVGLELSHSRAGGGWGLMTLRGNRVLSCTGDGISITGEIARLESNVVGRCGGAGIRITNDAGRSYYASNRLVRNTSYENGESGYVIVLDFQRLPGQFYRNIAYGNGRFGLEVPKSDSLTLACNDWFGNELGAVQGIALSPLDLTQDPLFCDVALDDVHLSALSPLFGSASCDTIGALGTGCEAPAAVQVLSFSASSSSSGVVVRWRVADAAPGFLAWLERADREAGPWAPVECERSVSGDATEDLDRGVEPGRRYWYRLLVTDRGVTRILGSPTAVAATSPARFSLRNTGPNPVAGPLEVEFQLASSADIALELFDAQGRRMATLARGPWAAGIHRAGWTEARGTAPGLYLLRYRYPGGEDLRRITIVR